jgi:hypothetical protein
MIAQAYKPELRSIPLTFMDCSNLNEWQGIMMPDNFGKYWCNHPRRNTVVYLCKELRETGKCPRGFP